MLKTRKGKGLLQIENDFYHLLFNMQHGTIKQFIVKNAGNSHLYREGCEMWDRNWGPFHPNHYQQERGCLISHTCTILPHQAKISFKSQLGISVGRPLKLCGWCENNWLFQKDTPLIRCDFKMFHDESSPVSKTSFKKYVALKAKSYTGWAFKRNDTVFSEATKKAEFSPHKGIGIPGATEKSRFFACRGPLPTWITFFNNIQGFALFLPEPDVWPDWPDSSYYALWTGGESLELLYAGIVTSKEIALSIGYLGYLTTPSEKWKPIEEYFYEL